MQRARRDGVRPGLDDEPHHAVPGTLVCALPALKLLPGRALPRHRLPPGASGAVELLDGGVVAAAPSPAPGVDAGLELGPSLRERLGILCQEALAVPRAALGHALGQAAVRHGVHGGLGSPAARGGASEHGVCRLVRHGVVVERAEELTHEPDLVALGIVGPGAAEHDELDLVGRMPHLRERRQPRAHLQVGVEAVLLGAGARRLVVQVALGHPKVARAEHAVARARPGLGDHGDGRHARGGAAGLYADNAQKLSLEAGRNLPRGPALWVFLLCPQVKGQKLPLGRRLRGAARRRVHELRHHGVVNRAPRAQERGYLQ